MSEPAAKVQRTQAASAAKAGDEEGAASDALTQAVGKTVTFPHGSFSAEGVEHATNFQPRPSDVFILTPPKTGTTWMQMLCHALRTRGQHTAFEDIYQVAPWDQMAWDLGQSLEDEQVANPRIFKSHQRLSSINRGARYLCMVRRPEDVLLSWWNFLRSKDVPPLRKYSSASEFVFDDEFFSKGMRFGATIWEYYVEFYKARHLPSVLVLCYEDLVTDLEGHLPVIARFLGLPASELAALQELDTLKQVLHLTSRQGMSQMESRFDESWAFKELQRVGRMSDPSSFTPSTRVHAVKTSAEQLSGPAQQFLAARWAEEVASQTGLQEYAELRAALMEEMERRKAVGDTDA